MAVGAQARCEIVKVVVPHSRDRFRSHSGFVPHICAIILVLLAASPLLAQKPATPTPEGVVPPPLNLISKEERTKLEAETKLKKRTKLALEFMDARLAKSEESLGREEFQESLDQLGRFQALIRLTAGTLKRNEERKGSFKNYKRFEMTLREFIPRLELIYRKMPYKYGYHVGRMIDFVRDVRENALDTFYDDNVVPDGGSER